MNILRSKYLSKKMRILSLACSFVVVLIHSNLGLDYKAYPLYLGIVNDGVLSVAVPYYFFVSGYFASRHFTNSMTSWFAILKVKALTLCVPYFLWNVYALGMYYLFDISGGNHFLGLVTVAPANTPLWFMKYLIVLFLILPLIVWIINVGKGNIAFLLVPAFFMAILPCLDISGHIKLFARALVPFAIGVYLSKYELVVGIKRYLKLELLLCLWIVVVVVDVISIFLRGKYTDKFYIYMPFITLPLLLSLYDYLFIHFRLFRNLLTNNRILRLCKYSFFVYCLHWPIFRIIEKNICYIGQTPCSILLLAVCVFILCLCVAWFVDRYLSCVFGIFTGYRRP